MTTETDMALLALLHAAIIGFMIFFMAIVPPSAFKSLPADAVGTFLRVLFPRMFLFGLTLSLAASVAGLVAGAGWQVTVSILIVVGFAVNVFVLTPKINTYRDRDVEGDVAAKRIFRLLHLAAVSIFLVQLAGSLIVASDYLFSLTG